MVGTWKLMMRFTCVESNILVNTIDHPTIFKGKPEP